MLTWYGINEIVSRRSDNKTKAVIFEVLLLELVNCNNSYCDSNLIMNHAIHHYNNASSFPSSMILSRISFAILRIFGSTFSFPTYPSASMIKSGTHPSNLNCLKHSTLRRKYTPPNTCITCNIMPALQPFHKNHHYNIEKRWIENHQSKKPLSILVLCKTQYTV